jgi:hypothetical protein
MANLGELNQWDAGVYRLETTDPAIGGEAGVANAPLKNLANRTVYLKSRVDALESATSMAAHVAAVDPHPTYTTAAELDAALAASQSGIYQIQHVDIPSATGTTFIPDDDTVPLSSEGTQVASLSITPSSSSRKVRVRATLTASGNASTGVIVAIFRGSVCVGSMRSFYTYEVPFCLEFVDSPASVAATTYTVRVGRRNSVDNWYINGGASEDLGGSLHGLLTLEEID